MPGLAIGIVAGDKLIYAKGFGVRGEGGAPVDTRTIFQIGSTTKAFLSATMAIAVDRGKLHWDDRVVDLDAGFQMRDPWVIRTVAQPRKRPRSTQLGRGISGIRI